MKPKHYQPYYDVSPYDSAVIKKALLSAKEATRGLESAVVELLELHKTLTSIPPDEPLEDDTEGYPLEDLVKRTFTTRQARLAIESRCFSFVDFREYHGYRTSYTGEELFGYMGYLKRV